MSERKTPRIRFPEFTGEWEQRKLEAVVNSVDTGKSKFDKEGSSGEYPILGSTSVIGYDDEYDYEGNFILTARVGANAGSLYRHVGKVKISDNTVFIQASQNIEFLYHLLTQFDIKKLSFGTGQPLVKASELRNIELMMPTDISEQIKIGDYFKNLDNLITLHQRKVELMKAYKRGCIQKMIPREGENVPEIRFPGFTGAWEQRKLSELVDYSNGAGHEDYVLPEGKYELITLKSINSEGELVSSGKYVDEEFETLKQNTLIMMLSEQAKGMLGMTTVIPCDNRYVLNQRVAALTLHDKVSSKFLTKAINNKQSYFEQMGAGTKVQNISRGHVENCLIEIPKYDEQKQIGDFFDNLDNLITLHQRECDMLKELKTGLLQQMFV